MTRNSVFVAAAAALALLWHAAPRSHAQDVPRGWEYLQMEWVFPPGHDHAVLEACRLSVTQNQCRTFDDAERTPSGAVMTANSQSQALATLGAEGWELVTVLKEGYGAADHRLWIFKRPRH